MTHPDATPAQAHAPIARDPGLVPVSAEPFNAELPLPRQVGVITPSALFYVRNHFPVPRLDAAAWRLSLEGALDRPQQLGIADLRAMPGRTLRATLECAGNGRSGLDPRAEGENWGYGAASTAEWTGVPLASVLERAGLQAGAVQVVAEGADGGPVAAAGGSIRFAHALPRAKALHPDTLLAYAMNGEPLPPDHGFPLRLLVPGWYGMCSVKWLTRLTAAGEEFRGFYQVDRYIMTHPERGDPGKTPLEAMRVRSLITSPEAGATLPRGPQRLRGLAWSGAAPIASVEVSVDGGARWQAAELGGDRQPYAWRPWEFAWTPAAPGPVELRSRAVDEAGNRQPEAPEWNRLGYANNAVQVIPVEVA